jgi:hypothetical protein
MTTEICSRCGHEIPFTEVAYMGPVDRMDTACSPFMDFEVICKKCEPDPVAS